MKVSPTIETIVAVAAGVACAVVAALVWVSVAAQQPVWPLPALYFMELIAAGLLVITGFLVGSARKALFAWMAGGTALAFSILAAWTVGFFFAPMALGFLAAGLLADVRSPGRMAAHAAAGVLAAALETSLILALAKLI